MLCIFTLRTVAEHKETSVSCPLCGWPVESPQCFFSHATCLQEAGALVAYKCEICWYQLKYRAGMVRHLRKHIGKRLFSSPSHPFKSASKTSINIHVTSGRGNGSHLSYKLSGEYEHHLLHTYLLPAACHWMYSILTEFNFIIMKLLCT